MNSGYEEKLTVAVCDTQPLIVEGFRSILAESTSYRLLEPARTLISLTHMAIVLSPRVAIADKAFGTLEVTDWLSKMRQRPATATIIWGSSMTDAESVRFLQAGAKGILRKTANPDHIMSCLDAVSNGGTWMDDSLFRGGGSSDSAFRSDLTPREQQVLELVEQGMRNKEIATELGIQPGTVKIHLKHIFEKSGVRGRYGLALSGLRGRFEIAAMSA
ncbi:MAG: response regulator transcription factor [Bryobacteraceae bacterium]|nr:response regulator transcription factor [Bryobacteraceae bacterium]